MSKYYLEKKFNKDYENNSKFTLLYVTKIKLNNILFQ